MFVAESADSERQLAANELRRMGFRVPSLKGTPTTGKQATLDGWPLFGVDILEQPQQSSHLVAGLTVPWFLDESLRVLISHASTEGILRKSGSLSRQRLLRSSLETSASLSIASVVLASAPVHDVSGLLKQWLQLLPEPLLPKPLLQLLLRCQVKHGLEAVLLGLRILPEERLACLRHLLSGLTRLAADPLNRMGAHNLALVLAPTLCCFSAVQGSNRCVETLLVAANIGRTWTAWISLVEVLIGSSHLVGSSPPPLPGREGRQKTKSACVLLNQLRRLVTQRKEPGGEMDTVVPDSSTAVPILPSGSKRRKPRELLPRGLLSFSRDSWGSGRAKREEGQAFSRHQQQACATPELLDKLREEVASLPPLQVEDNVGPKPGDANVPASVNPLEKEPKTEPAAPQTVHFFRGTNTTSSIKTNLRRGRPNSLRTGLPSPRPLRHGPGTRRHSSTGSQHRPPVGKENLKSSLRFTSQGECIFNAPAMAHLAAVKARKGSVRISAGLHGLHQSRTLQLPASSRKAALKSHTLAWRQLSRRHSHLPRKCRRKIQMFGFVRSRRTAPAPCNDDFNFALPDLPLEPSPSTKRESIIQIRQRNAGMVRSSVEVFNRAAAAARESPVVTRSRRTAVARNTSTTSRPPLRETNFRHPGSPTRRERRDWEMEL
ncbi:hypothetical protein MRX96_035762 [Rhipicephalus microplus]